MSDSEAARASIAQMLEAHEASDSAEAQSVARVLALVRSEPRCFFRDCFPGHLTGSAFVLDEASGRLLLTHHRRLDLWLQMGGHMEAPEVDPRETALREGREESGLQTLVAPEGFAGLFDVDVHRIPPSPKRGEPEHWHHDLRYALLTREPECIVMDEAESLDLRWFSWQALAGRDFDPATWRALHKLHARELLR